MGIGQNAYTIMKLFVTLEKSAQPNKSANVRNAGVQVRHELVGTPAVFLTIETPRRPARRGAF